MIISVLQDFSDAEYDAFCLNSDRLDGHWQVLRSPY